PDETAPWLAALPDGLVEAARKALWSGRANALSPSRVEWPAIDMVAKATRYPGTDGGEPSAGEAGAGPRASATRPGSRESGTVPDGPPDEVGARAIILQRRSALGFDAKSSLPRETFLSMLARLRPVRPPWDAIGWPPHIHLLVFVHRVDGFVPGLYAF